MDHLSLDLVRLVENSQIRSSVGIIKVGSPVSRAFRFTGQKGGSCEEDLFTKGPLDPEILILLPGGRIGCRLVKSV